MRNIWVWVVGVVVAAGAGIALYNAVGGREGAMRTVEAPAQPAGATEATEPTAPAPAETFDKVPVAIDEFFLGKANAPLTIVEYASMTCPHCAHFHGTVLPAIKEEYIDTGKVRLVFRDFPLDQVALRASMLARCAGRERFFGFIDAIFSTQDKWARDSDPIAALSRIALLGGMDKAAFDACLKNQQIADAVLNQRLEGDKTYHVESTPTLIIGVDRYNGGMTVDQMRMVIDAKLEK